MAFFLHYKREQGDQIGLILAHWMVAYSGLLGYFLHKYALMLTKMDFSTF
jgi:hypothetical protein